MSKFSFVKRYLVCSLVTFFDSRAIRFEAVSFHCVAFCFMPFQVMLKATAGKSKIVMQRRTSGERSFARKSGRGAAGCRNSATRGAQSHRRHPGICAASRYFTRPWVCIIYAGTKQNETKRNGKHRFLRIVHAVAISFLWLFIILFPSQRREH